MKTIADLFSLKGHTAMVTGSSRGIGRAVALVLAQAGAKVYYHGSKPSPKLDEALAEAKSAGLDADSVTADLSSEEDIRRLTAAVPAPDILVLNASVQKYMQVEDFDSAEFAREFDTNVRAGYLLSKWCLPAMKAQHWGRIIAIGSVNQWTQAPRLTCYAASKCAQLSMILSLVRSCGQFGITANNIAPGVITTDRNAETLTHPETVEMLLKAIPANRFGKPDDVAGAVLLCASDAGSYINGADIAVTGGMHL